MRTRKLLAKVLIFAMVVVYAGLFGGAPASAATLEVGPGKPYATPQAAFNAASSGDTILIYANGTYYGTNAHLMISGKNNITIKGTGGRPVMQAQPGVTLPGSGKGIWVVAANDIFIENIEFRDAANTVNSGAGVRVDPVNNPTFKSCYFYNNQNGILAAPQSTSTIRVNHCEFAYNGAGDGYSHSIYVNDANLFVFRYNYSHHVKNGHLLKTRARQNYIEYNRLTDEDTSSTLYSNYNIDVPNAGKTYIIGNLIHQGSNSPNGNILGYGLEGNHHTNKNCYIINNTIVNDRGSGTFMNGASGTSITARNNIFTGSGTIAGGSAAYTTSHNLNNIDPGYVNRSSYDYRLTANSTQAINKGTNPGTGDGYSLTPVHHYSHKCNYTTRTTVGGVIDIGAYEYGS